MIAKSLIAAAALATTMAATLPAPEARADVSVGIGIGVNPGFYPGYGYPAYYDPYPGYYPGYYKPYPKYQKYGISCGKGARIVDHSGFNNVTPIDCSLPRYKYTAWRKGKQYIVVVNGNGNIVKYYRS